MPHFFDLVGIDAESLAQRGLGEPRRDADAQPAGDQLEQRIAPLGIEPVEHPGEQLRRRLPPGALQLFDHAGQVKFALRAIGRLVGPDQRHGFGGIADEIARQAKQHRIDPRFGERADRCRFDPGNVKPAGQRGQRKPASGIGGGAEIVRHQRQLGVARPSVNQSVDQGGESLHPSSSSSS